MSNGKDMTILLIVGLIKKTLHKMSQYFPPYRSLGKNINVKVDLSNYATETNLKNVTHVDVSNFALKLNLASLKSEADRLDINKLVSFPVDLSNFSDVVKNDVVKKTVYDKLVKKVNDIDTTGFALKAKYDTDKPELEKKISNAEGKIASISDLVTNAPLTAVENRIPDVSNLVKRTDYNTKIK